MNPVDVEAEAGRDLLDVVVEQSMETSDAMTAEQVIDVETFILKLDLQVIKPEPESSAIGYSAFEKPGMEPPSKRAKL